MQLINEFRLVGQFIEGRELETKDKSRIWRRVVKVGFMGGALELIIPEGTRLPDFKCGEMVEARGMFVADLNGVGHQLISLTSVPAGGATKAA